MGEISQDVATYAASAEALRAEIVGDLNKAYGLLNDLDRAVTSDAVERLMQAIEAAFVGMRVKLFSQRADLSGISVAVSAAKQTGQMRKDPEPTADEHLQQMMAAVRHRQGDYTQDRTPTGEDANAS